MGKIITFSNQKGGSGKTTLAANLAVLWSNSQYKVAVIDADAQKSLTYWLEARKKYYGENNIGMDIHSYDSRTLIEDVRKIKRKYNFIIIDSPPSITYDTIQIVKSADRVYVPVQPSPIDLMATIPFLNLSKQERKKTTDLRVKVTDMIMKRFEKIGYNVKMQVLNAADYGVPQKRERVIFIGGYEGLPVNFPDQTYRKKINGTEDLFKSNLLDWITVREAIDDIKDHPEDIDFNHIFTKCGKEFLSKIKKTKVGTSVYEGYRDAYYRSFPDEPSNTVKENHGGVFIHYEKDRFMTPRELARLQSFGDDFIFKGSKSQILVQIGNAVPPMLGYNIASILKENL